MIFKQTSPSTLRIEEPGNFLDLLKQHLEYNNRSVDFEIRKFKKNSSWWMAKLGEDGFKDRLSVFQAERTKSLLFQDDLGYWTYSGLKSFLLDKFPGTVFVNEVHYPSEQLLAWKNKPKHSPRDYQLLAKQKLLEAKHGAVEIGTGLGKTTCACLLIKELGLQTLIMVPSKSIARQFYNEFTNLFGKQNVGLYGDGRKDVGKFITIGIAASLTLIEEGSEAWKHLSSCSVFISDESHLTAAQTLAKVCFGLAKNAPYRFFFSGTQIRGDGLELLLEAITSDIVFKMTVQEGVDAGYLSMPIFRMIKTTSSDCYSSDDAQRMSQHHLFYNNRVNEIAGMIANRSIEDLRRPVVILIEEVEQFSHLLPHLKHAVKFAHGGLTKSNSHLVPKEYHKSDPESFVNDFNQGKFPILIGTSCIGTGTDIQGVGTIIYLQGGKSEVQVKQAIGRGTRGGTKGFVTNPLNGEKKVDFFYYDFDVRLPGDGSSKWGSITHRHAMERAAFYQEVYPTYSEIDIG